MGARNEVDVDLQPIRKIALDISQHELAGHLGISQGTVSRMEMAGRMPLPYKKLLDQICPYTVTRTDDGGVIAFDPKSGISISRQTTEQALIELRRLVSTAAAA
jgi:transcriptional regulator with XRE-family HTH domain